MPASPRRSNVRPFPPAASSQAARMDPNSDLQAIDAARKTPDTLQNLESSLDGARWVILVGRGIAKIRQHSVAKILRDVAVVALHDLGTESLILRVNLL